MDVLRSVMFGLLTVSFILGVKAATVDRSKFPPNTSQLRELIIQARTDANLTFLNNCFNFTKKCENNQTTCNSTIFKVGKPEEMLQEMFHVSNNFTQLLDKFLKDIKEQQMYPKLEEGLKNLTRSLESVERVLQLLKPTLEKGDTSCDIDRSEDSTRRNLKNIQIVAHLAKEMDKMSKVLASF